MAASRLIRKILTDRSNFGPENCSSCRIYC